MTKTVKKLLICLMALAMTVCSGIALLGLNTTVAKAESTYDISILGTACSTWEAAFCLGTLLSIFAGASA